MLGCIAGNFIHPSGCQGLKELVEERFVYYFVVIKYYAMGCFGGMSISVASMVLGKLV